jgi:microcystin-dependent protein
VQISGGKGGNSTAGGNAGAPGSVTIVGGNSGTGANVPAGGGIFLRPGIGSSEGVVSLGCGEFAQFASLPMKCVGNVVVGTTTAWAKLSVQNAFGSTTPLFDIATTTSALFATSSVFRVNHDGNVGVGTTTPYAKLSVVGEAVAQNFTATSSSATTTLTNLKTTGQVDGIPPAGTMMMWAGASTTVPSGYLYADGRAVSRTTYAGLFTAIGTLWGSGDGSTTFNIPDARRRYPRGENTTEYRVGTTSSADAEGHDLNGILSAPQVEVDSNLDGSTSFVTSSVTFTSNLEVHGVVPTFVVGYIIKY